MTIFLAAKVELNGHLVDTYYNRCTKCSMYGAYLHKFPCPARTKMDFTFNMLKPFQMFFYNNHSFIKLKEKSFCFENEQVTSFADGTIVVPVESDELKQFKLRVERMVTDSDLVQKIFSQKNIQRLKDLKPGTNFLAHSNRLFTLLNGDVSGMRQAHCSNYYVMKFDPEELVEVVDERVP